jgi:hypothetical protein
MATTMYAPRFSLTLPVRYRVAGEQLWSPASTRNLSSSGVLFRAPQPLKPGTWVELEIELSEAMSVTSSRVRARGEVVRQLRDESAADSWFMAVKYVEYHMEQTGADVAAKFPAALPSRPPFGNPFRP